MHRDVRARLLAVIAMTAGVAWSIGLAAATTAAGNTTPGPSETASSAPAASPRMALLDEPFTLAMDETAELGSELRLTFTALLEDSRCPADVQCVWEGNARIELEVVAPGSEPVALGLDTHPAFMPSTTVGSYSVELIDLEPYPRRQRPSREPYRATLLVRPVSDATEASPDPIPEDGTPSS